MKNLKQIIIIGAIAICIVLFIVYLKTSCSFDNCDNRRVKNGKYCVEHTCEWEGCTLEKGIGKTHYCYYHTEQNALNNKKEDITLTNSQVSKIKSVIKEYCKMLIDKQSSVLSVDIINDYPEYVSKHSCSFRCTVKTESDGTKFATIYVSINNETYKVDSLMYD